MTAPELQIKSSWFAHGITPHNACSGCLFLCQHNLPTSHRHRRQTCRM